MTQVPVAAWTLARSVFAYEAGKSPNPDKLTEAAGRVETRLRERLSELIGMIGYAGLIARALRLAQAEIPALSYVKITTEEGGLSGIRDFVDVAVSIDDPHSVEIGLVAIFAHIIGLLSIFIGEDLAIRLVREGWPELSYDQAVLEDKS